MGKKWTAATVVRQVDTWTRDIYNASVLDPASDVAGVTLGQFIEDMKQHEFDAQVAQIPGQQQARSDEAGNVMVTDHDAPWPTKEVSGEPYAVPEVEGP